MARPAQKLTTVPLSTVDVGDTISHESEQYGVKLARTGAVHRIIRVGGYAEYHTQEGGILVAYQLAGKEPRVYMLERAPQVQPLLEMFA